MGFLLAGRLVGKQKATGQERTRGHGSGQMEIEEKRQCGDALT